MYFKASKDGYESVTSHVFDREGRYLDSDTVLGVKDSLIEEFVAGPDGVLVCEHAIVLASAAD